MSRGAIMQTGWGSAIGKVNPSFIRPPRPYFSVRLKNLSHLGLKIPNKYYGDTLTFDEMEALNIDWGDNETLVYDSLQTSWSYVWNLGKKTFTVTDGNGAITIKTNVTTISDLGICYDILESHNFAIELTSDLDLPAFFIGSRAMEKKASIMQSIRWSSIEAYLNSIMHVAFKRLIERDETGLSVEDIFNLGLQINDTERNVLLAKITSLKAYGQYPMNFLQGDQAIAVTRELIRQGTMLILGEFLMIQTFASINKMTKPVVEPWMLWDLWKWIGRSSVTITRDRAFDLSPWWGS
ncbi:MAG: hypothetical protein H6Q70_524 [Firmicutes bacterium]|nr:hypothetical protein [Bacillota bacterium]